MRALLAAALLATGPPAPVLVHDARERDPFTAAIGLSAPGSTAGPAVAYTRDIGRWRQFWLSRTPTTRPAATAPACAPA